MTARTRRQRESWLRRFGFHKGSRAGSVDLLPAAQFRLAIDKERCRAERRELVFCVVQFEYDPPAACTPASMTCLASAFRKRLRITDEVGNFDGKLCVLLPETNHWQAGEVAGDLVEIAHNLGFPVIPDILAWPGQDDDPPRGSSGHSDTGGTKDGVPVAGAGSGNGSIAVAMRAPGAASDAMHNRARMRQLEFSAPTPLWKRAFDIGGACTGLVVLSPVLAGAAIAVRLTSRGPVLFSQWREGKDGRLFRIYKFRTMLDGADDEKSRFRPLSEQDGPAFKLRDDPRLTPVGRYLRKTCIDELPQLLNVLRGEMSLVGPRPLPADESLGCTRWQRRRLEVLPGMTCIWQVKGGRDIPFSDWMRMDLEYIRRRSPVTDTALLIKTFLVTLLHRGSV